MIAIDPAIRAYLRKKGVDHCLIGGWALAARGYPRFTADIDFLTTDKGVLEPTFWSELALVTEIRKSPGKSEVLNGVVRWAGELPIDLMVASGHAARLAIRSAKTDGDGPRIATALALILLKLEAGGNFDLDDVARLLEVQAALGETKLQKEVEKQLPKLTQPARLAWRKVLVRLEE